MKHSHPAARRLSMIILSLVLLVTLTPPFLPANVYATEDIYTVTFNNGYAGNGSMETVTLTPQEAIDYALPECTMDPLKAVHFTGWMIYDPATRQPIDDTVYQPGDPYPVSRDIMLRANWEYTYTYHLRDAENESDGGTSFTVSYPRNNNTPDVLTGDDPRVAREGYKFSSWSGSPDYIAYPSFYSASYWVDKDLYAFWYRYELATYTASPAGEETGGKIQLSGSSYPWTDRRDQPLHFVLEGRNNSNYTLTAVPANTDTAKYKFVGWYVDSPEGELYSEEPTITFNSYDVEEDLTLCAYFEEDENAPLNLKMIANRGAQTIIDQEVTKDENGEYTITVPDDPFSYNNDCYLKCWEAYETGNRSNSFGVWYPGETRTLTCDTSLDAQWYFNITYHPMNGPEDDPDQNVVTREYRLNQRPIEYDTPVKEGYQFDNWYTSPEKAAQGYAGYADLYANKTQDVYAGYFKYRLTIRTQDSEMASGSYTINDGFNHLFPGASMTVTATPGNRSKFKGWYEGGRDGELFSTDNPLTVYAEDLDHDTTLYAVFDAAFEEPYVEISGFPETVSYQAAPIEPDPEVKITINGETRTLEKDKDYTVTYENNTNASTENNKARAIFTGKGEYQGEIVKEFEITPLDVDAAGGAQPKFSTYRYTGEPIVPKITVAGYVLKEGVDYEILEAMTKDNVNAGQNGEKASITIRLKGNNVKTDNSVVKIEFSIRPFSLLGEDGYRIETVMEGEENDYQFPYTGEVVTPAIKSITCTPEDESLPTITLGEGDYEVTYTLSTSVSNKQAYITGQGNFSGQITLPFEVVRKNLEDAEITIDREQYYYNGKTIMPVISADGKILTETDYTVIDVNGDQVEPGDTVAILIHGENNYTGTPDPILYQIVKIDLSDPIVGTKVKINDLTYTGESLSPNPVVTSTWLHGADSPETLYESTDGGQTGDYTLRFLDASGNEITADNIINAGSYTAEITGCGPHYQGTYSQPFTVQQVPQTITVPQTSYSKTYGNAAFDLNVTTDGDGALSYTSSNKDVVTVSSAGKVTIKGAGTATITVYAKAGTNYSASAKQTITVNVAKKTPTVTVPKTSYTRYYGNAAFDLGVTTNGDGKLTYTSSNKDVATVSSAGKVTIKGVGKATITVYAKEGTNYKESAKKTINVTVNQKTPTVTVAKTSYAKVYGNAAFPLDAKTNGDGKLTYKSGNTSVATVSSAGKVTIKGVGKATITIQANAGTNYKASGKKYVYITVKPKTRTISKVTPGSKKLTVKWTPLTTQASGYEVQIATNSGFTAGKKTIKTTSYKTGTATFKNLTAGKNYYVRIRTFKKVTVNGKTTTYNSAWKKYTVSGKVKAVKPTK